MAGSYKKCKLCNNAGTDTAPLKLCGKCKGSWYCSEECQRADWGNHKTQCAKIPHARDCSNLAMTALCKIMERQPVDVSALTGVLDVVISDPFTKLAQRQWLYDRPKEDVYKLLIDAYRLRVADDRGLMGFLWGHSLTSIDAFKGFLEKADSRWPLLPAWWTPRSTVECCVFGSVSTNWTLKNEIRADEVNLRYGNTLMLQQLRLFGEQVHTDPATGVWDGGIDMIQLKWGLKFKQQMDQPGDALNDQSIPAS